MTVFAWEITSAYKILVRKDAEKIILLWDMLCGLLEGITISEQSAAFIFMVDILQMEAEYFSEMFMHINLTTQCHIQEAHELLNFKSHVLKGTNCRGAPGYCTEQN